MWTAPEVLAWYKQKRAHGHYANNALRIARSRWFHENRRTYCSQWGWQRGTHVSRQDDGVHAWIEDTDAVGLRPYNAAHEIVRLGHTGWYTDDEGYREEIYAGFVWRLPGKDRKERLIAGYKDPNNDGAAFVSLCIYDNGRDAAYAADKIAERHAKEAREYNRAWDAGRRYADLKSEIVDADDDKAHKLCAEADELFELYGDEDAFKEAAEG